MALPTHIDTITVQKRPGWLPITAGPGATPCITSVPMSSAVTALVGMPSASIGTSAACAPALFAASGPATPCSAPCPNGRLGRRTSARSTV